MNNLKENPVGLDVIIDKVQKKVYDLKNKWGAELTGYPRCYILQKENSKTIEHYLGFNEYSGSLIHREENKFFFLTGERVDKVSNNYYTTSFELYFMLNIEDIYPDISHRADEEVRVDVLNVLDTIPSINVTSVESNVDKVFARFNNRISQNYEYDSYDNLHPYHYFKVLIDVLEFDINQKQCN